MGLYDPDVIPPPSTSTVEGDRKVVLYDAQGRPMVKKIGFTVPEPRKA
jgi:hypothetical protein